jgi:hypothetical protein
MPRPKKVQPDYRYHISGQAVVTFNGVNFYLGEYDSPKSRAKYSRLVAEYIESGFKTPTKRSERQALRTRCSAMCEATFAHRCCWTIAMRCF